MDFIMSSGKLVYDPYRGQMRSNTSDWCVVECDDEIARYYRWWLQREKHIILQQPSWGAHISVVRGEKISHAAKEHGKKHDRKAIKFAYEHGVIHCVKDKDQPGFFYWIEVECPVLDEIRAELGLRTGFKYHMTIGRTYY